MVSTEFAFICVAMLLPWVFGAFANVGPIGNVFDKLYKYALALVHMTLSRDKKWKPPTDPAQLAQCSDIQSMRIIFIRHGESDWNLVFNKGFGPSFIVRLFSAMFREMLMFITRDSIFMDSPLSAEGVEQAQAVNNFLEGPGATSDDDMVQVLRGERGRSIVVSSNLRRCLETGAISLWGRLQRAAGQERIHVKSSMQEVTFNIDGLALSGANEVPVLAKAQKALGSAFVADAVYDVSDNQGNKTLGSNGLRRIQAFNEWLFTRDPAEVVILSGHSLWFRSYFQSFVPKSSNHIARTQKLQNCAVVSLTVSRGTLPSGGVVVAVDPASIRAVFGDFEAKKGSKKKKA